MRKKSPDRVVDRPSSAEVVGHVRNGDFGSLGDMSTRLGVGVGGEVTAAMLSAKDGSWHKPVARKEVLADEWRLMVEVTEGTSGRLESGLPTPFLYTSKADGRRLRVYMSRCEGGALSQQQWLLEQANAEGDKLAYYRYVFREFYRILGYTRRLHETSRVVHRDIKLENVLLDDQGRWLLCDLGSALRMQDGEATAVLPLKTSCLLYGSIYYNPLEIGVDQPEPICIGPEVDVWALGALLGAMLPEAHRKSLVSWAELEKSYRPEHAAARLIFHAMTLNKPKPLEERARRCEAAKVRLAKLVEGRCLPEGQLLVALSSLGDWMTAERGTRPSCSEVMAVMRSLLPLVPSIAVETVFNAENSRVEVKGLARSSRLPSVFPRLAGPARDRGVQRIRACNTTCLPGLVASLPEAAPQINKSILPRIVASLPEVTAQIDKPIDGATEQPGYLPRLVKPVGSAFRIYNPGRKTKASSATVKIDGYSLPSISDGRVRRG